TAIGFGFVLVGVRLRRGFALARWGVLELGVRAFARAELSRAILGGLVGGGAGRGGRGGGQDRRFLGPALLIPGLIGVALVLQPGDVHPRRVQPGLRVGALAQQIIADRGLLIQLGGRRVHRGLGGGLLLLGVGGRGVGGGLGLTGT